MIKPARNSWVKRCALLFIFFFSIVVSAQSVTVERKIEHIIVKKDASFVKHIQIILKPSDEAFRYPIFYDSELEEVSNLTVYSKKGKRFKRAEKPVIFTNDLDLDYIASKKVKSIVIPANTYSKISYTVGCKELMYFASLPFFSSNTIDTLVYQVTTPKTFHFVHDTIATNSLKYIAIDSVSLVESNKTNIKLVPKKIEPDPLALFGIYKNKGYPLMRTIVVPASYKGNEKGYMNDWYLQKIKTKRGLNSDAINKINGLTEGVDDDHRIVEILYNYVKNNFKYVAIEVGMGAFIPTHSNEVFKTKEGDCKDLSNFLSEALTHKGIDSDIALAATYDHISECNFPSLSAANHVVCLAYLNGVPIVLDPTDPIHTVRTPVQSIQDRSILIVNDQGGKWHKTRSFTSEQNLIDYEMKLAVHSTGTSIDGSFNTIYNGISGNFIKRALRHKTPRQATAIGKNHFKSVFNNPTILDLHVLDEPGAVTATGTLSISGKIFNDRDSQMVFLDFLPKLVETVDRDQLLEGTHLGSNFSKKLNLQIEMNKPFKGYEEVKYEFVKDDVSLHLSITNPAEKVVAISYEFICNSHAIEKINHEAVNDVLKSFKKVVNDPLILQQNN